MITNLEREHSCRTDVATIRGLANCQLNVHIKISWQYIVRYHIRHAIRLVTKCRNSSAKLQITNRKS